VDTSESRSEIAGTFSKCGAGESWRSSFGPIVREMRKYRVKEERNILHTIKGGSGHTLRRNCLLKRIIEGKIEGSTEVMGTK
jgi:hypothetical protein